MRYDSLSVPDLYAMLQLRAEVFVVEQACAFQDLDGADSKAMHLLGYLTTGGQGADATAGQLVAYARLFPAGVTFAEASIGRVVMRNSARGKGLGHSLVRQAIGCLHAQWGVQPIRIGAQTRLKAFYTQHGFVDVGRPYVEDGIDHIEMLWKP